MVRNFTYIVLFLFFVQTTAAQENAITSIALPVNNSLRFNKFLINPTFSFAKEEFSQASFFNRRQWTGFENAPNLYLASFTGRIDDNSRFGVALNQQDFGLLTNFGGAVNYAYNVEIDRDVNLTFGANLYYYNSGINTGKIVANDPNDPLFNGPKSSLVAFKPGINYGTEFVDFGIGINNLFLYDFNTSKLVKSDQSQTITGHFMYTGMLNNAEGILEDSKFTGLVQAEKVQNGFGFSGNALLNAPNTGWAQAGYNSVYGASVGVGLYIKQHFAIGYTFEKAFGNFSQAGATHEFTLAYIFSKYDDESWGEGPPRYASNNNYQPPPQKTQAQIALEKKTRELEEADRERLAAQEKVRRQAQAQAVAEARDKERLEAEAKAKAVADAKAKGDAEEQEKAQLLAEAKAKAAAEALAARNAEQDAKAREQAAAEARDKALADAKAKAQQEADAKAQSLADAQAKAQADAEEKARVLADAKAKAQQEADAKAQSLADAQAKAQADAEEKARVLADAKAKAQQEADAKAQSLANAQAKAQADAEEKARVLAEAKAKAQQEADAKAQAIVDAQAKAKADAEEKAKAAADAKAQSLAEAKAKAQADAEEKARAIADAKAKAQQEADAKAQAVADAKAKSQLEADAKAQALAKAKAEADEKARVVAEAKAKAEADAKAKAVAEAQAKADAEEKARLLAEAQNTQRLKDKELEEKQKALEAKNKESEKLLSDLDALVKDRDKDLKDFIEGKATSIDAAKQAAANLEKVKTDIARNKQSTDQLITDFENKQKQLKGSEDAQVSERILQDLKTKQAKLAELEQDADNRLTFIKQEKEKERLRKIKLADFKTRDQLKKEEEEALRKKIEASGGKVASKDPKTIEQKEDRGVKLIKKSAEVPVGVYLILDTFKDAESQNEFISDATASGIQGIKSFYNLADSTYYVYSDTYDDLNAAVGASKNKGSSPYKVNMFVVKVTE
jgi:type IX secretion system PorP/SprF family membrane protein